MNPPADAEAVPKLQRKPLTLRQAGIIVLAMICFILLLAASGIHALLAAQRFFGSICCLLAFVWLPTLSIYVHLYRQVKKGKEVILRPLPLSVLPRIPFWISITFTSHLTLLVAAASITSFESFASFKFWTPRFIILGFNLFFWLVTAFGWYCALKTEHRQKEIQPVREQIEGVWPPTPQISKNE